jgi:hypothetical protein
MAIEKPPINSEGRLAGLRRLTAKPAPVRIFLDKAAGRKRARATGVRAGKRPALEIVQGAAQAGVQAAAGVAETV